MSEKAATLVKAPKPELSPEQLKAKRMNLVRTFLPVAGLLVVFIVFNLLTNGRMINSYNLLLSQLYVVMISSIGVFFIMSMGGLDFSQGSILGMASLVVCLLSSKSIPLAILGGIATGAAIGAINGFFYVNRKIKSFIVTICTMFLFRGLIKYFTSKAPVAADMKVYNYDDISIKLPILLVILAISFVVFRYTKFGIYLKAIGAGEKAASFAGIRTDRMKFLIYVLAGAITGFAAFISVTKNGSVTANAGNQLETQILIALVLGGMPISGGAKVRFSNIIVGATLYVILSNGLTMIGMTPEEGQLIQGIIFLIFVAIFADRQALKVIK